MTEPTNEDRAEWAAAALDAYSIAKHERADAETPVDLLTDLMHWCDAQHIDFDAVLKTANMHYEAETTEGGES